MMWEFSIDSGEAGRIACQAAAQLAMLKVEERTRALRQMAQALDEQQDAILEANTLDLEASREMAISGLMLDWLKLTPERLQAASQILQKLAMDTDPSRRILGTFQTAFSDATAQIYRQLMPLGVIALIYEAFPELAAIATGLCIRTGNSLILKGGSEASQSNQVIAQILQSALETAKVPTGSLVFLPSEQGCSLPELVTQDQFLNLVIPYGRPSLVDQVVRHATVPVLKSAIGNCYLYWSNSANLDVVRGMILESHQGEPDAVNAIEKVLIAEAHSSNALTRLFGDLEEKGFNIRGDKRLVSQFPDLSLVESTEWNRPYLQKTIAFKTVDSLEAAITWINQHSSGHADCLATESYQESRLFAQRVNSASVYTNTSPRFSRNSAQGDAIALGMSNQKGYCRGPINLETLTTIKHVVQGHDV